MGTFLTMTGFSHRVTFRATPSAGCSHSLPVHRATIWLRPAYAKYRPGRPGCANFVATAVYAFGVFRLTISSSQIRPVAAPYASDAIITIRMTKIAAKAQDLATPSTCSLLSVVNSKFFQKTRLEITVRVFSASFSKKPICLRDTLLRDCFSQELVAAPYCISEA